MSLYLLFTRLPNLNDTITLCLDWGNSREGKSWDLEGYNFLFGFQIEEESLGRKGLDGIKCSNVVDIKSLQRLI